MSIEKLLNDKATKSKEKVETIGKWLLDNSLSIDELIDFASKAKDPIKATCIEALEFATKEKPTIATEGMFAFVTQALAAKAPRIKWESAKVIGNTAHLFTTNLDDTIKKLIENLGFDGTVVRWSAAFALGEILKLKTKHNKTLLSKIEAIIDKEEKNSIKKIYLDAVKKL